MPLGMWRRGRIDLGSWWPLAMKEAVGCPVLTWFIAPKMMDFQNLLAKAWRKVTNTI